MANVKTRVKEIIKQDFLELYENIELPCLYSLYDMEKYGIKVNKEELIAECEKYADCISKYENDAGIIGASMLVSN